MVFWVLSSSTQRKQHLFERLAKPHQHRASKPIMKVFVDFFRKIIRKECYLGYSQDMDFIAGAKRKCMRRSYAVSSIKEKIKDYEHLFSLSSTQMPQFQLFEQGSQYSFSLTIPGDALDCFRIWEAPIFNNIVISKSHPFFDKFLLNQNHQLPIALIEDYKNIIKENLEAWYSRYANFTSFNNEKTQRYLQLDFWMNYMRRQA